MFCTVRCKEMPEIKRKHLRSRKLVIVYSIRRNWDRRFPNDLTWTKPYMGPLNGPVDYQRTLNRFSSLFSHPATACNGSFFSIPPIKGKKKMRQGRCEIKAPFALLLSFLSIPSLRLSLALQYSFGKGFVLARRPCVCWRQPHPLLSFFALFKEVYRRGLHALQFRNCFGYRKRVQKGKVLIRRASSARAGKMECSSFEGKGIRYSSNIIWNLYIAL